MQKFHVFFVSMKPKTNNIFLIPIVKNLSENSFALHLMNLKSAIFIFIRILLTMFLDVCVCVLIVSNTMNDILLQIALQINNKGYWY